MKNIFNDSNFNEMKKTIIGVFMIIFSLGATTAFAKKVDSGSNSESKAVKNETENKLTEEEVNHLRMRVEEIRDMDKSELTVEERRELKSELKEIKKNVKKGGGTVYIGAGTLILVIILVILLL